MIRDLLAFAVPAQQTYRGCKKTCTLKKPGELTPVEKFYFGVVARALRRLNHNETASVLDRIKKL